MSDGANRVEHNGKQYHTRDFLNSSSKKRLDLNDLLKRAKDQKKNDEPLGDFCNRIGPEAQFKKIKEVLDDKIQ